MNRLIALILDAVLLTHASTLFADEYVEVADDNVNIRISASSSATVVGQASKGMIFEFEGTEDQWQEIALPSGEYRYVHSSLTKPVAKAPPLTTSTSVLKPTCRELVAAEDRATDEAIAREPDIMKQIDLERLLTDRYKLPVFKKYDIAPARNSELTLWCAKNRTAY